MSQDPILIVISTNRNNSLSAAVGEYYGKLLQDRNQPTKILALTSLPQNFTATALYHNRGKDDAFNQLKHAVEQANKYVFIVPEYNGSFPGILKTFIDGLDFPNTFLHKKCALVGVSQGPGGSLTGLSHLTDVFHYLRMHVFPEKVYLRNITDRRLETVLANTKYPQLLQSQAEGLIAY